jgi:hypothetical protein
MGSTPDLQTIPTRDHYMYAGIVGAGGDVQPCRFRSKFGGKRLPEAWESVLIVLTKLLAMKSLLHPRQLGGRALLLADAH